MNELTAAHIDLALLALEEKRIRGTSPPPCEITPEYLARLSDEIGASVGATTWRRIERTALDKCRHLLSTETQTQTTATP
jgi:hypothetical protein